MMHFAVKLYGTVFQKPTQFIFDSHPAKYCKTQVPSLVYGLLFLARTYQAYTATQKYHKRAVLQLQLTRFENDDNFTCKIAHIVEEANVPIESGFEYVTDMDLVKMFKKRK